MKMVVLDFFFFFFGECFSTVVFMEIVVVGDDGHVRLDGSSNGTRAVGFRRVIVFEDGDIFLLGWKRYRHTAANILCRIPIFLGTSRLILALLY